jgi:hypothetical protein
MAFFRVRLSIGDYPKEGDFVDCIAKLSPQELRTLKANIDHAVEGDCCGQGKCFHCRCQPAVLSLSKERKIFTPINAHLVRGMISTFGNNFILEFNLQPQYVEKIPVKQELAVKMAVKMMARMMAALWMMVNRKLTTMAMRLFTNPWMSPKGHPKNGSLNNAGARGGHGPSVRGWVLRGSPFGADDEGKIRNVEDD